MEQRKEKTRATETAATKTSMKIPRGLRRRIYACRRAFRPDPDGSHESYTQKKARPKPGFSSNTDSVFRSVVETVARLDRVGLAQGELVVVEEREIRPARPVLVDRRLLVEQVVDDQVHVGLAVHERVADGRVVDHLRTHPRLLRELVFKLAFIRAGRAKALTEQRGAEVAIPPVDALIPDVLHRILGKDTEIVIEDVCPAEIEAERADAVCFVDVIQSGVDTGDFVVGRINRTGLDRDQLSGIQLIRIHRIAIGSAERVLTLTGT